MPLGSSSAAPVMRPGPSRFSSGTPLRSSSRTSGSRFTSHMVSATADATLTANGRSGLVRDEAISDAGFGDQVARSHRIGFELLAQLLHVDAQVMRVLDVRRAPHLAQELAVRDHHPEVLGEAAEQPELDRRQTDFDAVPRGTALLEIHLDVIKGEDLAALGSQRMAQSYPHPGQELAHAEWLGDVIVGAGVERLDLGALLGARRQHEDRHRRPGADPPDDLDAV